MGYPANSRSSFRLNPEPATEASYQDTHPDWHTGYVVEDVNRLDGIVRIGSGNCHSKSP